LAEVDEAGSIDVKLLRCGGFVLTLAPVQ
jgi:hypothetical protein